MTHGDVSRTSSPVLRRGSLISKIRYHKVIVIAHIAQGPVESKSNSPRYATGVEI